MRILHVGKYYAPFEGGIENFLASFLKHSANNDVTHLVMAHHHRLWRRSSVEHRPEATLVRSLTLCKLLFAPISPFFHAQLKSHIQAFDPDVIHVHMPNLSAFWLLLLGPKLSRPIVVHWHADVVSSRKNLMLSLAYLFYRVLEKRLLARAAAIIVTSPPYLQTSRPLGPWREKCQVIPLGLEPATSTGADAAPTPWDSPTRFKLLCIGRLTYYKGQQYLIRAVAPLPHIELVLVGTGKAMDNYKALVDKLGIGERVRLFGHATAAELDTLLATCDGLCLPSIERTEAFGLVLLEAMRQGKPCICTDVTGSGMSWVVQDGVTGLVAKSEDADDLRRAIAKLADDPALAAALGRRGYARYTGEFTMETVTKKILALYNEANVPFGPVHGRPTHRSDK